jgi:hypothetical protein
MTATKSLGAIALAAGTIVGCGGNDSAAVAPASTTPTTTSTTTTGSGDGGATADNVTPAVCGGQGQHCCATGALCGSGLTCSDEYCLACGAPPAPSKTCTEVAHGAAASAGSFDRGAPDDPSKVVDGNVCTSWNYGSYADANSKWQVDLGRVYTLDALTLWPKMTPADGTVQFLVEYKAAEADAYAPWPTSGGLALTLHDYTPWQTTFSPPISARYFRITVQGTPSFVALREVALYTGCSAASGN